MPFLQYLSLITLLSLALGGSYTAWAEADVLIIENVKIVSVNGVSKPTDVVIEGSTIIGVGSAKHPPGRRDSVQVIDGRGQYLAPGLIDSHVHLLGVPGESDALPAKVRDQALAQIPKSYLYFGFTTVLDLISTDELMAQWNRQPLAPTAYHCVGTPIPGGYPMAWLAPEEQLTSPVAEYYLYDENQPDLMAVTPGSDQHKPKALVERIANTKARCIKTFYEKGFGRLRNLPVPSPDSMKALIREAHKHQLPVFLHGNSRESYEFALEVGVDMLAHGPWHGVSVSDISALRALANSIAQAGIGVQPTIQVISGERELFSANFFEQALVKAAMPQALRQWYQSEAGQWFVEDMSHGFGGPDSPHLHDTVNAVMAEPIAGVQTFTRVFSEAGGDLIFGSDTPSGPVYTQFPGLNGYQEIQHWVGQGIAPTHIFAALTVRNAELLGLTNTLGTVTEGKRADLLLMADNPLESVEAYNSIEWVVVKGVAIKRAQLAAH
ncbi:amidohydrolase family protein [Gilvimarinus agarilyticus]|uniref:amidohydrolase family protein n=1 Tax=Gilvimarinus sp. 2_MG-2023 TaxID=3062666 RepID=UPI001C07F4FC|nr:amidohydrolase family protein [Gilvimarinus sp. 2_MG-2023]MBU2885614.1 amidohydrolase family protein [Gilvimarinus agarilyticus]MDO6570480.1 amidohydrolase family protein [Gilvimarinus sp. 2_MG-2023]